eukprot:4179091-Amphidinium_carterae.1
MDIDVAMVVDHGIWMLNHLACQHIQSRRKNAQGHFHSRRHAQNVRRPLDLQKYHRQSKFWCELLRHHGPAMSLSITSPNGCIQPTLPFHATTLPV